MKKVFQSKIFQIAIFLILIVAVVAGLIFVVRKNKMKDQTYKETILLQDETDENGMCINAFGDDMLGQEISVERKALKIGDFEDLSNGFTPRLHLLKVNYPMNDESALRDAGCFFLATLKDISLIPASYIMNDVKKDYAAMKNMIYGAYPEFEQIIECLKDLETEIHRL